MVPLIIEFPPFFLSKHLKLQIPLYTWLTAAFHSVRALCTSWDIFLSPPVLPTPQPLAHCLQALGEGPVGDNWLVGDSSLGLGLLRILSPYANPCLLKVGLKIWFFPFHPCLWSGNTSSAADPGMNTAIGLFPQRQGLATCGVRFIFISWHPQLTDAFLPINDFVSYSMYSFVMTSCILTGNKRPCFCSFFFLHLLHIIFC